MLEKFYRENYHIVYGYLLSLCGDPTQADELTAETFCRAVEKIEQYDPRYKPSTWLCTMGRNLFLNDCRRKKRLAAPDAAASMVTPSPEVLHMQKETLEAVWRILRRCAPDHRQVFLMRLEGMAFRDIGLALGKTETWARVTYFRVKSKILQETEGLR
ncbi:MAG: sigma-70 family RNA polymerase sigma factor [Oscillospiraceae bacterium]|nr:sigma-70 family RNA polymerase sigma factor [Oscillospiraceae bacterium]